MGRFHTPLKRAVRALWFLVAVALLSTAQAKDVFVILSGGVSPMENNYSQFLQAKALSAYFSKNYPPDSVWLFFGAGNVEGEKPVLGDVYHRVKRDSIVMDTWQAGALPNNHTARRTVFLKTLREEILPAVRDGGTIYLFVGDHGSRTGGRDAESVIDLWSLHPDATSDHGWAENEDESLGVSEFRAVLLSGIGKGKLVFCMTQCHAGGFHFLAVPHEMTPNPRWFTSVPSWAKRPEQNFPLKAAGYTATDELSVASGCDPSPDPDQWAGYERFIPEKLLGLNLFTLEHTGKALPSFAAAHAQATMVDRTIDKPYSTSEQYLERWADLIETRLAQEPRLTSRAKQSVAAYEREVNGAAPKATDAAFRERQALFRMFTDKLAEQNSEVKNTLLHGNRSELEEAAQSTRGMAATQSPTPGRRGRGRRSAGGAGGAERRRLWNETVRPAWQTAVDAAGSGVVPSGALEFEKYLLGQEEEGANFFFGGTSLLRDEVFWRAGYSNPQTLDAKKAEAISAWATERRTKILAWAKDCQDETVRNAADRLTQLGQGRGSPPTMEMRSGIEQMQGQHTAAERVLFYRRVLGAWEFLLTMNERPALARIKELTELERTPLPKPGVASSH